jgi:glycosyltransferase involved in cell wall biosynthesis
VHVAETSKFTSVSARMRRPRTALVIPTLNEAESIGQVIAEIPRSLIDRIIVADGGSRDATVERAALAGADVICTGSGYGRACYGAAVAAEEAEILVFMDGDGADDPKAIASLVTPIAAGFNDFVVGSRVRGGQTGERIGWHQLIAGFGLGLAMQLIYGVRYTDMCAFRAIRRDALLALGMTEMTYGWNLEMQMRAARRRLRILEVPVSNRERIGGTSKVAGSFRGSLRAGTRILATFTRQLTAAAPANRDPAPKIRS